MKFANLWFLRLNQSSSNSKKKKKKGKRKRKKKEREREKKKTKSKEFPPIIFFFCTCLVYNWVGVLSLLCIWDVLVLFIIYFFYSVYLKYLTWRAAVSSAPVFGQQVASLSVSPLALALSPELWEVRTDALIPVNFRRPVRNQCSTRAAWSHWAMGVGVWLDSESQAGVCP